MDDQRELGKAFLALRRAQYQQAGASLTKDHAPLRFKADATEGLITGYASTLWVVDSYGEVTAPGCFQQSIKENGPQGTGRIPIRYEHEETVGTHTLMREDDKGLYIEGAIKDDGDCGTKLRVHLSEPNPVAYGLSIGYRNLNTRVATPDDPLIWDYAPRWMREDQDPTWVIVLQQIKLKENSTTVFPANEDAWVESFKADALGTQLDQLFALVKSGALTPIQLGLLREIAKSLPAETAPETGQAPDQPGEPADSETDADFALLDLTIAQFERLIA